MILSVCCVDSTVPDIHPPHCDTVLSATIHSLHSEYLYLDQKIIMKISNVDHQRFTCKLQLIQMCHNNKKISESKHKYHHLRHCSYNTVSLTSYHIYLHTCTVAENTASYHRKEILIFQCYTHQTFHSLIISFICTHIYRHSYSTDLTDKAQIEDMSE